MSSTDVQIVRFQKNNVKVEVLGKPGMVTKYREGKCSLQDAIIDDRFYSNASRGTVLSDAEIAQLECSGTQLLELILKTGKYGLTAAEKREMVEKKRLEVINYIHDNFIDSTNGRPHPVVRIESALNEIKAHYDPEVDTDKLVHSLVPKLQTVIRLAESTIEGTVKVPNSRLGQVIGICYNLGTVKSEKYGPEHAFIEMTVTPGKFDELVQQISRMSQGEAVFQIAGAAASEEFEEKESTKVRKRPARGNAGKKGKK